MRAKTEFIISTEYYSRRPLMRYLEIWNADPARLSEKNCIPYLTTPDV